MRPPDPVAPLKQQLAEALVARLDEWPQALAAALLDTYQPRISNLRNNQLDRFSLDRLVRFVDRVGGDVSIQVVWARRNFISR